VGGVKHTHCNVSII